MDPTGTHQVSSNLNRVSTEQVTKMTKELINFISKSLESEDGLSFYLSTDDSPKPVDDDSNSDFHPGFLDLKVNNCQNVFHGNLNRMRSCFP